MGGHRSRSLRRHERPGKAVYREGSSRIRPVRRQMLRERARIGCISDNRFCPLLRESLLPLWVAPHHTHVLSLCDQSFCYYASSVPCGPCNHVHRFLLADRLRLISFSVGMRVRVPRMRGASVYRDSYKARMPDRPGGLSEWLHPPEARSEASQIGGTLGGRAIVWYASKGSGANLSRG